VWIAAHWDKKLSKAAINHVSNSDIVQDAAVILKHEGAFSLRLRGHLLYGLCRIYYRKVDFLYSDCTKVLVKIKNAFRPAANIDLDERSAALGTIALDTGVGGDYELEFPEIEEEMYQLPEQDDNVLSLHEARRKTFLAGPSRTPSMGSAESPAKGIFGDELDLLAPRPEIDSSAEIMRGGDISESGIAAQPAPPDVFSGLDWGMSGHDGPRDHDDDRDRDVDYGDVRWSPGGRTNFGDAFAPAGDDGAFAGPEDTGMPPPTSRAKGRRTWADVLDEENTKLEHEFLMRRIRNVGYYNGAPREVAPDTTLEVKRRKLEEQDGNGLLLAPILRTTPKPLRSLMRQALAQTHIAAAAATEDEMERSTGIPAESGRDTFSPPFGSPEAQRAGEVPSHWHDGPRDHGEERDNDDYGGNYYAPVPLFEPPKLDDSTRSPAPTDFSLPPSDTLSIGERSVSATGGVETERLSEASAAVLGHYKSKIAEKHGPLAPLDQFEFSFQTEFASLSRRNVATTFLSLLELCSKDYVEVEQEEPYSKISFHLLNKEAPSPATSSVGT
jgi:hypothetical protein